MRKSVQGLVFAAVLLGAALPATAAQLNNDARAAIPREVQQLVVVDYRAMQESQAAMQLRERVMPPELKQFDEALRKSGLNDNHDVDSLAFALYRLPGTTDQLETVGIAQGQFSVDEIVANFRRQRMRATVVRTNRIYPMGKTGMVLSFVDASTMVFGSMTAVKQALDVRDGMSAGLLTNYPMLEEMRSVDSDPLWSILDAKGTQTMMRGILGEAGSVADYESVRKRLLGSWYSMNFQHGVRFDLTLSTGDTFAAATISSLLNAAVLYRRMSGSEAEKAAMSATDVSSHSGKLVVHFAASNAQFDNLLRSSLFQSIVR